MLFAARVAALETALARLPSAVVALSGGVDSAALLGAAARALGPRAAAATARSPAVPGEEVRAAAELAARLGVAHAVLDTDELADPRYRRNDGARCYWCRVEMYGRLRAWADARGIAAVLDGGQADDAAADRPGMRAAAERGVVHPLRAHGFTKPMVRRLARAYGLAVHDKPAQPCLASRLRPGVAVTAERLALVHRAETAVRALGFRELRVRWDGAAARVEIGRAELARALAERAAIVAAVEGAGAGPASVDPAGYR